MYTDILCTDDQINPRVEGHAVCLGIALAASEVPEGLVGMPGFERRRYVRGGRAEFRFLARDRDPQLPVWHGGRLHVVRWGNRRGESRRLPRTGWTWLATIESGGWQGVETVPADIPASYGYDGRGVWYLIEQGIRGLMVSDERGTAVVYMICEPASHYYHVMTGATRMPVLIGQPI